MEIRLFVRMVFLFYFVSAAAIITEARARAIAASGCSQQEVQKAIDMAADGDTVLVPAGSAVWTTLQENRPAVVISAKGREKQITLQGAGIGKTIITDATGSECFQVVIKASEAGIYGGVREKAFRITGFTFKGKGDNALISTTGYTRWRIDHCRFENSGRSLWVSGTGLIDNCTFDKKDNGQSVFVPHMDFAGKNHGDGSWSSPLSLGTEKAVYIEDCTFKYYAEKPNAALDGCFGTRVVFRHNTLVNAHVAVHGTESSGRGRSIRSYEVYDNSFTLEAPREHFTAMFLRGGTGVIFDNRLIGGYRALALATNYRSRASFPPWGKCDGSSKWDGNQESNGYPAIDQIGRSTDSGPGTPQELDPLYEWGNTLNGADADIAVSGGPEVQAHIKEGRDYHNDKSKPDYAPHIYPHPLVSHAPSPVIMGLEWAPKETIVRQAKGSDNWPLTWADDGHLYTTWVTGTAFLTCRAEAWDMQESRGIHPSTSELISDPNKRHLAVEGRVRRAGGFSVSMACCIYGWDMQTNAAGRRNWPGPAITQEPGHVPSGSSRSSGWSDLSTSGGTMKVHVTDMCMLTRTTNPKPIRRPTVSSL